MTGKRPPKPPKKSDPLMVRMPHERKQAFLNACRDEGRTASGVVRELIDGWLRRAEARARLREHLNPRRSLVMVMKSPLAQGGAIAAGLAALALFTFAAAPSAAQFDYRASFEALDANHDGVITLEEYAGGGSHSTLAMDLEPPSGAEFPPPPGAQTQGYEPVVVNDAQVREFELEGTPQQQPRMARVAFMMDIGFAEADRDGDGAVDFDEFVARHEQLLAEEFAKRDADGDGRLVMNELTRDPDAPPGAARASMPPIVFEALDRDGDGAITLSELQAGPG